jgi:hypothetical protein
MSSSIIKGWCSLALLFVLLFSAGGCGRPGKGNDSSGSNNSVPTTELTVSPHSGMKIVLVNLTGTGDGGTWYMIDGDICEGEEALKDVLAELRAEAQKAGKNLAVKIVANPDSGISKKALNTAARTCLSAGARLIISKSEAKK